jgi:hypothetical protein
MDNMEPKVTVDKDPIVGDKNVEYKSVKMYAKVPDIVDVPENQHKELNIFWHTIKTSWWAVVLLIIALAIMAYFILWTPTFANAQSINSVDFRAVSNTFNVLTRSIANVIPIGVLLFYMYKMRPKDIYEAAWLAIAWCAVAYINTV